MQVWLRTLCAAAGSGEVIAKFMVSASSALQFVAHFRAAGYLTTISGRAMECRDEGYLKIVPETLARLFKTTAFQAEADRFSLPPGNHIGHRCRGCPARPRSTRGIRGQSPPRGDTRSAHPQPALHSGLALEKATSGHKILVVASERAVMRCFSRRPRPLQLHLTFQCQYNARARST